MFFNSSSTYSICTLYITEITLIKSLSDFYLLQVRQLGANGRHLKRPNPLCFNLAVSLLSELQKMTPTMHFYPMTSFINFALDWETHIHDSPSGYLTSPYYPSFYLNNLMRSWTIEVPRGQRIQLDIIFLNLQRDQQCGKDSVIVKESARSRTFTPYCGNTLPTGYSSSGNVVYVKFRSDESNVGTGFKMHYQAISCKFCTHLHNAIFLIITLAPS